MIPAAARFPWFTGNYRMIKDCPLLDTADGMFAPRRSADGHNCVTRVTPLTMCLLAKLEKRSCKTDWLKKRDFLNPEACWKEETMFTEVDRHRCRVDCWRATSPYIDHGSSSWLLAPLAFPPIHWSDGVRASPCSSCQALSILPSRCFVFPRSDIAGWPFLFLFFVDL